MDGDLLCAIIWGLTYSTCGFEVTLAVSSIRKEKRETEEGMPISKHLSTELRSHAFDKN